MNHKCYNYILFTQNFIQISLKLQALDFFYKHRGGGNVGFPIQAQDYCLACKQCKELCQNCNSVDLLEASTQAALQGGVILSVCALCILLYLIMLYLEKLYDKFFNPEKNKEKPWQQKTIASIYSCKQKAFSKCLDRQSEIEKWK